MTPFLFLSIYSEPDRYATEEKQEPVNEEETSGDFGEESSTEDDDLETNILTEPEETSGDSDLNTISEDNLQISSEVDIIEEEFTTPSSEIEATTVQSSENIPLTTTVIVEEVSDARDISTTLDDVLTTPALDCETFTCPPAPEGQEDSTEEPITMFVNTEIISTEESVKPTTVSDNIEVETEVNATEEAVKPTSSSHNEVNTTDDPIEPTTVPENSDVETEFSSSEEPVKPITTSTTTATTTITTTTTSTKGKVNKTILGHFNIIKIHINIQNFCFY